MSDHEVLTRYPQLAQMLYNTPLFILPEKAYTIEQVFRNRSLDVKAPLAIDDVLNIRQRATPDQPYTLTEGGTAVIPVFGSLVHRIGFLDAMSGLTGYTSLANRLAVATRDAAVKGILLEMDTPGGEAAGLFELADQILQTRAAKPIWAAINEDAFSAGYAIAAATQRITAPRTARTGSIGVIALHVDESVYDAKQGTKYTPIFAGAHKNDGSIHEPINDAWRAKVQQLVDAQYGIFVEHVAAARGISADAVRATQAQVYTIQDAIGLGLADNIASLDETVAQLEASYKNTTPVFFNNTRASARTTSGDPTMKVNDTILLSALTSAILKEHRPDLCAELATEATQGLIKPADQAAAIATAKTEGAQAERARIQAVQAVMLPGHAELVSKLMFDGQTTGPEAALQVLNTEKAKQAGQLKNVETDAAALAGVKSTIAAAGAGSEPDQGLQQGYSEEQCKTNWDANKGGCQQEFTNFEAYKGFTKAQANGKVRILGQKKAS